MSDDNRMTIRLYNPVQGYSALIEAFKWAKAMLMAGHRLIADIRAETRSDRQNRFLHALIGDVSKQGEWMGKKRTPAEWKVLFVSGHSVVTNEGAEMIPGLEREFVNIRESTATMSRKRAASLCEYVLAYCANNGIELREAKQWIDPETGEVY